jgi:phage shock protein PspC (stress-responsive transcriptional regulator)
MPIYKSKIFWTLVAGVIAFVAKYYSPEFPFTEVEILAAIIFVLNLFKIEPELRARGLM